nr:unnamed protein product [Digitaria exilis]CAB3503005.1 unnamed protein product [Digitaria exilis]
MLWGWLQSSAAAEFQVQALVDMKMDLNDNNDVLSDWKDNQMSPCYWDHVYCEDNKVITISLSSSGLTGVLSPSIAKLTTLQQLILEDNSITGGIPQEFGQDDHRLEFGQIKRFSWRELQIATNNFSEQNVLGKGGFGKVYKGVLSGPDSIKIAVKRLLNVESRDGELAFLTEVELISIAVHKNILRLIGFCTTPTERLLVYPFMENLSVASRLRDIKLNEPALDWSTRMRIALGAARGLEYLHEHCNPKIIHRDVKAANVLLDGNFEAVVGDFGLAKMMDIGRNTVTTGLRGTMGHIAPEYIKTGRPSVKTDIFGYGVTLLEIVTGERAIGFYPEAGEIMLIDRVKLLMERGQLQDIVDCNLGDLYNFEELEKITQIALLCTQMEPDHRPAMSEVVQMLEGELVPAERWEEWQLAELSRRQQYEMRKQRQPFSFSEESLNIQEAIELSTGR